MMSNQDFTELVHKSLPNEPLGMIEDFCSYWCETSLNGKKMRFEGQKFFDIKRRFGTWKRNAIKFGTVDKISPIQQTLTAMNEGLKT